MARDTLPHHFGIKTFESDALKHWGGDQMMQRLKKLLKKLFGVRETFIGREKVFMYRVRFGKQLKKASLNTFFRCHYLHFEFICHMIKTFDNISLSMNP